VDASKRLPDAAVAAARALHDEAARLPFFALVAMLERLAPQRVPVGTAGPAVDESIRFRHDPSLTFSAGDVSALEVDPERVDAPPFALTTTFLGVSGAASPLPNYLLEEVAHEDPDRPRVRAFLDIFHHRMLSLLVRARSRYQLAGEASATGRDVWALRSLALAGVDGYERARPGPLPAWRLLRLVPLLATRARTGQMLAAAIEDLLSEELEGARVEVRQFTGGWATLAEDRRARLGGPTAQLGRTAVLGRRVFDRAGTFRVRIAPLARETHERLMPDGDLHPLVRAMVDLFVRDPLDCELELVLADAVHAFRLGTPDPARLGRDTYLAGSAQKRSGRSRIVPLAAQPTSSVRTGAPAPASP
jgi:type VI secretion system protein ImpH